MGSLYEGHSVNILPSVVSPLLCIDLVLAREVSPHTFKISLSLDLLNLSQFFFATKSESIKNYECV